MLTETTHAGEFLLSEGNGAISRETVTVAASAALPAGQVLGVVTATGEYAAYNNAATDGTETAVAVLYAPLADTAADRAAVVIARLAEVAEARLTGLDAAAKADLAARNIFVR